MSEVTTEIRRVQVRPITSKSMFPTLYRGARRTLAPLPELRTGRLVTGLTSEEEKKYLAPILGLDPADVTWPNKVREFWTKYKVLLTDKKRELNLEIPEDLIMYKFLCAHKEVAKSHEDILNKPFALFVMTDVESDAKTKNKSLNKKRMAYAYYDEMTPSERRDMCRLYKKNSTTTTDSVIENTLMEEIEKDADTFILFYEDANKVTKILIEKFIQQGIIKQKKNDFSYNGDYIASSIEDLCNYMEDNRNANMVLAMRKRSEEMIKNNIARLS